ncbi:alpha-protein kinase 1 [Drosophila mojavensis]|uniref:Uncharacterized protein n=1 Tax=Drosophila mojavensis TaxID=7230 RepID=B4KGD0_DROMO|nr:alpha-protein kinase 1 [Drosophila mojavensis]EDW11117.1 uncharacterized protein Dmoj_GI16978 [Drosophila mojavensis]
MIIVLLLLFQSLCLFCQRLVLRIHDRCFPRNVRVIQELAETVGDRKALQHLENQELEQTKRKQKRRLLEPILPLGAGLNLEACRFCAHSPQGYCRHHFHLQLHTQRRGDEQDYKQQRRIRRELKRSLEPRSTYPINYRQYSRGSSSSLSSGYGSLASNLQEDTYSYLQEEEEEQEQLQEERQEVEQEQEQEAELESINHLITSHL